MRLTLARIGGALLIAGTVAVVVAAALALGGLPVGSGVDSPGGIVFDVGIFLWWFATTLLAIIGEAPLGSRSTRIGLGTIAIGLVALVMSSVTIRLALDAYLPFVLQLLLGIPITVLGWLVAGVSLARAPAPARLVGRMMVGGVAIIPVFVVLSSLGSVNLRIGAVTTPLAAIATALILAAMGGTGYLALSDRWSWRQPDGPGV